ncbi:MAG: O-antigen ligase family protein [Acidobacteria bacterium]|nr:O-antigen ligase family protein [Acidobacteriota bacterium]
MRRSVVIRARTTRPFAPKQGHLLASLAFAFLCLFVFAIPLENAIVLPGVGTMGRMVGLAAFGMGILAVLDTGKLRSLSLAHLLMAAFVVWTSLTYFWSGAPERTLEEILTYLQLLAMVWLIWQLAPQPRQLPRLMQAYLLGTAVSGIGTILQNMSSSSAVVQRYAAFNINPNDAGLRLALSVPLALYLAAVERGSLRAWLYRLHLVVAVWAISLTASRGALIALLAGLLMIPLSFRRWTFRQKVAMAVVMGIAAFTAVAVVPDSSWLRLGRIGAEISQGTMNKRTVIWQAGVDVFLEHPFEGVGAGVFGPSVQRELGVAWVAHNTFLSVLVEQGVVGFSIFLLLLLTMVFAALRMPPLERSLWIVMLLTWAVGVSAMTWEYSKPTWFLFGLLTSDISALSAASERYFFRHPFPPRVMIQ